MAEKAEPTEEVSVDSKILSQRFLNAIGITASLTEKGVQDEVKKILKEQGISDEEATNIIDNSISADEVQPTDIPEFTVKKNVQSFTEYPTDERTSNRIR